MTDAGNQIGPMAETFASRDRFLSEEISKLHDALKEIAADQQSMDLSLRQTIKDEITQMREELVKSNTKILTVLANTSLGVKDTLTARVVRLEEHVGLSNEADGLNAEIGNSCVLPCTCLSSSLLMTTWISPGPAMTNGTARTRAENPSKA